MSTKYPLTPAGIEPATFRFVAQHLNHCATAVPLHYGASETKTCMFVCIMYVCVYVGVYIYMQITTVKNYEQKHCDFR